MHILPSRVKIRCKTVVRTKHRIVLNVFKIPVGFLCLSDFTYGLPYFRKRRRKKRRRRPQRRIKRRKARVKRRSKLPP